MSGRAEELRAQLETVLAPDVVRALEELVTETVRAEFRDGGASVNGASSPWLSIAESAGYLRISERKLERLIAGGRLRSTTIGRRRLLHRDDLDALAAATGEGTAPTVPPRRRAA